MKNSLDNFLHYLSLFSLVNIPVGYVLLILFPIFSLAFSISLSVTQSFFNKFILFIYFWLHWVFIAVRGLSLVAVSGGVRASHCGGFSCCGARALGVWVSVLVARSLSSCDTP